MVRSILNVLVAPDKFAGTLGAAQAAEAMAAGWLSVRPDDRIRTLPLADGGTGTLDVLAPIGEERTTTVAGPLGTEIRARFMRLEDGTAVIESAQACGLHLLDPTDRDPLRATTHGVGELIEAARETNPTRIVVGLGGSATVDGGIGMLRALGAVATRDDGRAATTPADLSRLASISALPVLTVPLVAAADVDAPLLGPQGAARSYGPQKGATPRDVEELEAGLVRLADVLADMTGRDLRDLHGAGAAGGLGMALQALGAEVTSGAELIGQLLGLHEAVQSVDVVLTGEGSLDAQSLAGKAPMHVHSIAREHGTHILAVAGRLDPDVAGCFDDALALGPEGMDRPAELVFERTAQLAARVAVE